MELNIIQECYKEYKMRRSLFTKIDNYERLGKTDSLRNFEPIEGRSNLKIECNFMAKLIDEEASYSFVNDVTYTAKDGNDEVIKYIEKYMANKKADHDINVGRILVKNACGFEITYIDKNNHLRFKHVSPLEGYCYFDEDDEVEYFLHIYTRGIGTLEETFIDVYSKEGIYHFDEYFKEIKPMTVNLFGIVPVGAGSVGGFEGDRTIYRTIKSLQDAYETNFSDSSCEISDFRNAILKLYGNMDDSNEADKDKQPIIRGNAVLNFEDKSTQDAEWLIKNINDTFVQNTLDRQKDMIYSLTSHIDNNEKMQSNLSGQALRTRLNQLENKCKINEKAMENIIRTRLKCIFRFVEILEGKKFDVNNIKIQFTPSIPVDNTAIADMISKIPHEVLSNETKRSLLSFIENPISEGNKIKTELKNELDSFSGVGDS